MWPVFAWTVSAVFFVLFLIDQALYRKVIRDRDWWEKEANDNLTVIIESMKKSTIDEARAYVQEYMTDKLGKIEFMRAPFTPPKPTKCDFCEKIISAGEPCRSFAAERVDTHEMKLMGVCRDCDDRLGTPQPGATFKVSE